MSIICPLFSSSSGNSTYIGTANGGILVDVGSSFKSICQALGNMDVSPNEIFAVAVTHEHIDHVKGLKTFLTKTDASLLASQTTLDTLAAKGLIPPKTNVIVAEDTPIELCGTQISRFATSHDCEGSSAYSFTLPDLKKFSLCTDLGIITEEVRRSLQGSDLVLLESNHDVDMLKKGPYPPELKVRILSDKGHISNAVCSAELKNLLRNGTKRFVLGHLSQHNNTPLLAKSSAVSSLIDIGAKIDVDYLLTVAKPSGNGVTVL